MSGINLAGYGLDSSIVAAIQDIVNAVAPGAAGVSSVGGVSGAVGLRTVNGNILTGVGDIVIAGGAGVWGAVTGTLASQGDLVTALATAAGNSITSASTAITVVPATHDNKTLNTTANTAVALTLDSTADLATGMTVIQRGTGRVTLGGSATFISPNGLRTSGPNTTMVIIPTGVADTYEVIVNRTSDATQTIAASGATPAVELDLYNVFDITLTANCTPVFSGAVAGQSYCCILVLRQDGTGGRTLTIPTTIWDAGNNPTYVTTANAINIITLLTLDGGASFCGFLGGLGMAV